VKLEGAVTIVTGAGRGIGRQIALTQAAEGAKVALLARTASEIGAVAEEIGAAGGVARAWPVDVTDLGAIERVVGEVEEEFGPVGLVTNNAAAFAAIGPIWEVDPTAWWRDVETNVRGPFHLCRAVLPAMMERKRGRIINMIGGGTSDSFPMGSGYATSKAGLLRFTECVADSVAGTGCAPR
jgi:NAD(P)-dependent dehydrogenase (short-subunit alcohol dehydrogenase family)